MRDQVTESKHEHGDGEAHRYRDAKLIVTLGDERRKGLISDEISHQINDDAQQENDFHQEPLQLRT